MIVRVKLITINRRVKIDSELRGFKYMFLFFNIPLFLFIHFSLKLFNINRVIDSVLINTIVVQTLEAKEGFFPNS